MHDTPAATRGVALWARARPNRVRLATLSVVGIIAVSAGTSCRGAAQPPQGKQSRLQASAALREQVKSLGQAAEQGDARTFRRKAEQGDAGAQFSLGVSYREGKGVPRDYAQAVSWWRKSAGQGYASAQSALGFMYANGQGVSEDAAQAVVWYRKAADQGVARAQFNLGVMCVEGQGVVQDRIEAYKWLSLAASLEESAAARDRLAQQMTPAQIAEAQRRAQAWTAAFEKRKM
jgi:TPR repeat protein